MSATLARAIRERYRGTGGWARFHVGVRVRSCPFGPVLGALPREGLIASLGCGHGAFEIGMILDAPGRRILGADIDERKLPAARAAAAGLPATFHHGDLFTALRQCGERPVAIVVMDVLCLISLAEQERILGEALAALAPGGLLAIKEMDRHPAWKWRWNLVQEWLSCRVLRITRNEGGLIGLRASPSWIAALAAAGFEDVAARPLHRGYPHPHVLILGRRPAGKS